MARVYVSEGDVYTSFKRGYKHTQRKPYIKPLPYDMRWGSTTNRSFVATNSLFTNALESNWTVGAARNKATTKLVSALQQAEIGNTVGESLKTIDMIANRTRQIATAAIQVKKGRIADAASTLGISPPKRRRPQKRARRHRGKDSAKRSYLVSDKTTAVDHAKYRTRSAASIWLELHYGWSPLLGTIEAGVKVLNSPPPYYTTVSGRQTLRSTYNHHESFQSGRNVRKSTWTTTTSARAVATYSDVTRQDQLQLTSLGGVLWEVTPFSFIVDWFIPVNTVIALRSSVFQKKFVSGYTTSLTRMSGFSETWFTNAGGTTHDSGSLRGTYMYRTVGSPSITPQLDYSFLHGSSAKRAGHAIALLVNAIGSLKRR